MNSNIIAWVSSFVLGLGIVWHFVEKYKGVVRRALKITQETSELIGDILDAMDDKTITKEEIEKIAKQIEDLQAALKGV